MKESLMDVLSGLAKPIAVAVVLGGGAQIIANSRDIAVVDARQEAHITAEEQRTADMVRRLERIEDKTDRLLQAQGVMP